MAQKKIKNALISVFHKDNLEPIIKRLNELGVTIYSTGGTQSFIEDLGAPVTAVESLTSYPSILGLDKSIKTYQNLYQKACDEISQLSEESDPLRDLTVRLMKRSY